MTEFESSSKKISLKHLASTTSSIAFHFRLPEDSLALRSVRHVDGVPELIFDARPKVPTIQEEDVAAAFRLASENKRPGFFYINFPPTHPLHQSRLFMQYSPAWLRWTAFGKLFAEADWSMKCLHVGTRTNEERTIFESWSRSSNLLGLAPHLDFPKDGLGPTIMSCEYAKMQKGENEIVFPEEPKMKITDGCSSLYSKYITAIYPNVAYHDEPRFLKMQEMIKLVLAVEWLHNEKGVRVNQEWMMGHTSKPMDPIKTDMQLEMKTRREPPYTMIPQPTVFERPSIDVTVKTPEAEMYKALKTECGVKRQYGYYDFGGAEVIKFNEDGTKCPPQKCLKFGFEHNGIIPIKAWHYVPLSEEVKFPNILFDMRDKYLALLPPANNSAATSVIPFLPMPVSVDRVVEDFTDESGMELKITESFHTCPPLALPPVTKTTTVMTATVDNYKKLYANVDPNEPIQPEIPGVCELISPDVKSWNELISELTVPIPRVWQDPFVGFGEPTSRGGVTARNFEVREEPLREKVVSYEETEWRDNYKRRGSSLVIRAANITAQGMYVSLYH